MFFFVSRLTHCFNTAGTIWASSDAQSSLCHCDVTHFRCCCVVVVVGRNRWFGCSRLRWRFERCRRGSPRDSEALRGAGWTMANWKRTTVTDAHCLLHSIIFVADDIAAFDSSRFISLAAAPHDTSMILKMIYIAPTWWWTCPRSQETRQVRGQFLLTERPLSKFHSLSEKKKKRKKRNKKKTSENNGGSKNEALFHLWNNNYTQ